MAVSEEKRLFRARRAPHPHPERLEIVDEFAKLLAVAPPAVRLTVAAVVEGVDREAVRHQGVDELAVAAAVVPIPVDDSHVGLGPRGHVRFPEEP